MMMASGIVRCGSFTSSPAVETASRPMKEKKIPRRLRHAVEAERREVEVSEFQSVNAITMNSTSTPSLITP